MVPHFTELNFPPLYRADPPRVAAKNSFYTKSQQLFVKEGSLSNFTNTRSISVKSNVSFYSLKNFPISLSTPDVIKLFWCRPIPPPPLPPKIGYRGLKMFRGESACGYRVHLLRVLSSLFFLGNFF